MPSNGFPPRVRYTPVPNPLFGPLLEQIDDLAELKCTLRAIWLLNQKRGYPRVVTLGELQADRTLGRALPDDGTTIRERIERAMDRAVQRGTLASGAMGRGDKREQVYVLNSEPHRKMLESVTQGDVSPDPPRTTASAEPDDRRGAPRGRAAIPGRLAGGCHQKRGHAEQAELELRCAYSRALGARRQERWRTWEIS